MKVIKFIKEDTAKQRIPTHIVFEVENMRDEGFISGVLTTAIQRGDIFLTDVQEEIERK